MEGTCSIYIYENIFILYGPMINLGVFNGDKSKQRICHVEKYSSLLVSRDPIPPVQKQIFQCTLGGYANPVLQSRKTRNFLGPHQE
jgi:hypothetical protein